VEIDPAVQKVELKKKKEEIKEEKLIKRKYKKRFLVRSDINLMNEDEELEYNSGPTLSERRKRHRKSQAKYRKSEKAKKSKESYAARIDAYPPAKYVPRYRSTNITKPEIST
jgi:hypothetical protein